MAGDCVMVKKMLSFAVAFVLLFSFLTCSVDISAKDTAVNCGAESFNPVMFYQTFTNYVGETVNTTFTVKVMDGNYKIRVNSISAFLPYYADGTSSNLNVEVEKGVIVEDLMNFNVSGTIAAKTNTTVRYSVEYDILDSSGKTVWKNLMGYGYGHVSASEEKTGAIGEYHEIPGKISDGCYFEILDTLNTTYVQVPQMTLIYKIRTQVGWPWNYKDARTTGVNVVSGNAPSTFKTMPDNPDTSKQGQMDWPEANGTYRSVNGNWARLTTPPSGYYNFTVSFNSWNNDWEDQTNITETTEMYYLSDSDRASARRLADKIIGLDLSDLSLYVQKNKYTAKSWDNLLSAIDMAYQIAYAVPDANYGFKIACQNALTAVSNLEYALSQLKVAEHDFTSYSEPVITEPTCTQAGSRLLTCICGEQKTEKISSKGHVKGSWSLVKEQTCTENGLEQLCCTVCNEVIEERVLNVLQHTYIRTTVSPTCVDSGYISNRCFVCGDTYVSDLVEPTGHSYQSVVTEPTCTEEGFTTYTCSVCSDTYTDDYVEASGHDYETTVIEPTKAEEGYTVYQCKNCEYNYIDDYVPPIFTGVIVSGTVKSFATNGENSETAETKIELFKAGEEEPSYTVAVAGTGVCDFILEDVEEGTYILRVTKESHAVREYEIAVASEDVTCELVIHLLGDINGDGRVNTIDTARANSHAKGVKALEGYEAVCADINGDGRINTVDAARMNAHAKGVTPLW